MVNYVTIQDKGYYDVSQNYPSGGIASEEIAYGSSGVKGEVINLYATDMQLVMNTLTDDSISIQKKDDNSADKRFEFGEVDKIGIEFPTWTIKGVFQSTNTDHMKDYGRLLHCVKTKGYKQIAVTSTDTTELLSYSKYGEREYDAEGTKTISSFDCRIISFTCNQVVKKGEQIIYTLVVQETK